MEEKDTNFNFRCDSNLKAAFEAACLSQDVKGAQVLRAAMREYVRQHAQAELPGLGGGGTKRRKR